MVDLRQFLPRLLPYVVGCSEPFALQALRDSAIDFCNRTAVVSVDLDPITVVKGIAAYEIEPPDRTRVSLVQRVWLEGRQLSPAPYEQATAIYGQPNGSPAFYFCSHVDEVHSITLVPAPDRTIPNGVLVRAALTPTRTATEVHDILFNRYADGVIQGAVAIIAAVPDQPFTDVRRAVAATVAARTAASTARIEGTHGHAQNSMQVKMRTF